MEIFELIRFFEEHDLWPHGLRTMQAGEKTAIFQYNPTAKKRICIFETVHANDLEAIKGIALRGILDKLRNNKSLRKILLSYNQNTDLLEHIVTKYEALLAEDDAKTVQTPVAVTPESEAIPDDLY